jgi:glycosyltransferase involved in cell wall biosynthesis
MPRPPRICHLTTTWYERAGSSQRTLEVIRGLVPRGYEIDLWVGQEASETFLRNLQEEGIGLWRVPGLQKYISPLDDLRAFWALKRQFARRQYDVVHTHLAKAGILGRLAARWAGVPIIVHTVHGPSFPDSKGWGQRRLFQQLERWASRYTHANVYVGKELRQQYLEAGIGTRERSCVIYTGREFGHFLKARLQNPTERQARRAKLGFPAEDILIGYVARVVPSKGHIYAIRAAQQLKDRFPRMRFFFIGQANLPSEQHYKNILLAEVRQRGLQDHVIFHEYQDDIQNYYAIFDIFILPSLYEGLPNVVLEAAVMGLPVVAFDCGGVREILGDQACLAPRGDLETFSQRLEEALTRIKSGGPPLTSSSYIDSLVKRWHIGAMIEAKDHLYQELLGRSHQ